MKQRRKVAILLVVTLVLQMMPLPVGSLAGVFGIFSVSQAKEPKSGTIAGVSWKVDDAEKTLTLKGTGTNATTGDYGSKTYYEGSTSHTGPDAPWGQFAGTIETLNVTSVKTLGDYAFYYFDKLKSVSISGVTEIKTYAFSQCDALQTISLPNVTVVGDSAFYHCDKLTSVTMPEVTKIETDAFMSSALSSVSLPKVTAIGSQAFYECSGLTSVTISKEATVGASAFRGCSSLNSVKGSGKVTSFGDSAFYGCEALKTISLNADASMGTNVFGGSGLTQVIWPSNSTAISDGAFQNCSYIETITIPDKVTKLGNSAFSWCSSATAIEGLDNVTEIGTGVFSSCNSLTDIAWPKDVATISNSAFADCTGLQNITIPEHITTIGTSAFAGCGKGNDVSSGMDTAGITVTIPDSVTTIGNNAFSKCYRIKKFVVGAGVTSIGEKAFYNCNMLSDLEWKTTGLTSIGTDAFSACGALGRFTVLASVTSIGVNPFNQSNLTEISVESGNTKYAVENKMLVTTDAKKKVVSYPRNAGRNAVVPNTVKVIGEKAFNYANISTVELPEGLESMEINAFDASGLTKVKLPGSLKSISQSAFANTASLESVEFQTGLERIESKAFFKASALEKVHFPGSLKEIESGAFQSATALTSVNGEGGMLSTVGASAFEGCGRLKDVNFGGDLQFLGAKAFKGCTSISGIKLPDKLKNIGAEVFGGCTSLKRMVFPNSIESIGNSVFSGCTSLESVDFGSIIKEITGDVFLGCYKLTQITISENNPHMMAEENVLYNKPKTELIYYAAGLQEDKFTVPEGVETIGSMAFNYCGRCNNPDHVHLEELRFSKTVNKLKNNAVYYNKGINKIFFYGNAPEIQLSSPSSSSEIRDGKKIYTYSYNNNAIQYNQVGSNLASTNKGLVIFVLKDSTGWENGWNGTGYKDTETERYVLNKTYHFDNERWDPTKTDRSKGKFDSGLEWEYRDDIGELKFIGTGEIPDFEEGNLFTWVDDNASEWLDYLEEPKDYMPDVKLVETGGATRIGNNTFKGAVRLYRVSTEECLTEIGESAFADCPSLEIVDVSNVQKIEKEAFKNATSIKDDMDARGVREIGEGAFRGCNGMTEILLGEGLQSLGKDTFAGCSELETMMLPESTESLGEGCFTGCSTLRTINIPAGIQNIPPLCFKDCTNLQKVYFYGDCPETREADAFENGHEKLVIYCRAVNTTWDGVEDWNGVPVVHLDKFYTEGEDHYSFPNSGSSFGYGEVYYIPLQRYVTAMQSIIRGSFYHAWSDAWGGSCFGMASSSTEFYQGTKFNVKKYTASAENLYDVSAPRDDRADLTKLIEIYQVSQFEGSISSEIAKNGNQYRKLINQVEEFERSGGLLTDETADPLVMCLYSGCSGHAVVPVAVNMDNKGNYILDVYDCNYPSGFQKLKISKDFKSMEYDGYRSASFVKYSTIRDALKDADFSGLHVKKRLEEESTINLAVNREDVSLVNGGDRDYGEIEGAYEQKPISDGDADEFSGIRSFVLPQREVEYEIKGKAKAGDNNAGEAVEDLKYYIATEDLFSEVKTSDEDAVLTVKSYQGTGNDFVILSSENENTETNLTVMDVSGIEKEIAVTGSSVSIEVNNDSQMEVKVSEGASVTVNGAPLELSEDNKATVSFYAKDGENPIEAEELSCELALDENNKLSGTAQAFLTWKSEKEGNVDIVTKLTDENGKQVAKYTETKRVGLGMQTINTELDKVTTELNGLSGDLNLLCEMTLAASDGNKVTLAPIYVSLRAAGEEKPTETPTEKPTEAPTAKPTTKPSTPSSGNDYPVIIPTPTVAPAFPSPSATVKPTEKPGTVETLRPVETPKPTGTAGPIETLGPVQTQEPAGPEAPGNTESSVPKKGQIKAVGGLKYIVTKSSEKNGTVAVHSAKNKGVKKVTVPKKVKINGYAFKVTAIREKAFSNMKKLSQVKLGANVKTIGNNAFKNCKKLQFVIIPGKVTTIGKGAFAGCKKLNRMLVKSNKLKSVGAGAFSGVTSNVIVKTSGKKWKQYSKMFTGKGKMSQKAKFIINPVKLKFGNKSY